MGSGRYVLLERIGVGGMAEVFRAMAQGAEGFERVIAVKRILPSLSDDPDFVKMFVDEAKIAVQLQHPNIVSILDLGREGSEYFIAMEYVHGKDLRGVLDGVAELGHRMPVAVVLHIATKICEALHHAHIAVDSRGRPLMVVHRDVTPQNVLLSFDGDVKVTDFGLAKAKGRATVTQRGVVKGKLAYMAPESIAGRPVDPRVDVFGVGILLWEMLTGLRLFLGKTDVETLKKLRSGEIPSIRTIDPSIPEVLDRIVMHALERDPDRRYSTAEELHDALEEFAYEHQLFVSTSVLASWLRAIFPGDDATERQEMREGATRAVLLSEIEPHVVRSAAPTTASRASPHLRELAPQAPEDAFADSTDRTLMEQELESDLRYDGELTRTTVPNARSPERVTPVSPPPEDVHSWEDATDVLVAEVPGGPRTPKP
jgi:eukaryotic-like serine/threonine-protein kinase